MTTDQTRRRFMALAALSPGVLSTGGTRALERSERPTLEFLGGRLRRREMQPGEALHEVEANGLACLDMSIEGYQLLDESAKRSVNKWLRERAGLDAREVTRTVWTRSWALVEWFAVPPDTAIRFVDHGPPAAIIAALDRGTDGIVWPEEAGTDVDR